MSGISLIPAMELSAASPQSQMQQNPAAPCPQLLNHLARQSPDQPQATQTEKMAASVASIGLAYCEQGGTDIGLPLLAASRGLAHGKNKPSFPA